MKILPTIVHNITLVTIIGILLFGFGLYFAYKYFTEQKLYDKTIQAISVVSK